VKTEKSVLKRIFERVKMSKTNKEKCSLCQKEYFSYSANTTRTTDNKIICINCYNEVSEELFKGTFSFTEATDTVRFINMFRQIIIEYINTLKKYEIYYGGKLGEGEFLAKIREVEELVSLKEFKRSRQVQVSSKVNHLILIKTIKAYYLSNLYPPIPDNDLHKFNSISISNNYSLGCKDILTSYLSLD
jgi:hypothetical protein